MKRTSVAWILGVASILATVDVTPAQAGLANLVSLLRSPVGRYLLLETVEGSAIATQLLGHPAVDSSMVDQLIAKLGTREMSPAAHELEIRLSRSRLRFRALAADARQATALLDSIAADELSIRAVDGGGFQFAPTRSSHTFDTERAAFLRQSADNPGLMAAHDMSGKVADSGLKLAGCDLRFAELSDLQATGAQFNGSLLESVDLRRARIPGADFSDADLTLADLRGARLKDARFRKAVLTGADFRGAHLNGADFTGADLRSANLEGARMEPTFYRPGSVEARFSGAMFDARTKLPFSREVAQHLGMVFIGS